MRNSLKLISLFFLIIFTTTFIFTDAYAKRFGGGRSFGTQRSVSQFSRSYSAQPNMNRSSNRLHKWLGPIAGLALGGLLASLFMGHGLGQGLLTWLVLGAIVFMVIQLIRRNKPAAAMAGYQNMHQSSSRTFEATPLYQPQSSTNSYPAGFNAEPFLREAKANFIRLQTAYDQKNLTDLRQFTTPQVFAEIQIQLHERGNASNQTDVLQLEAELLDVTQELSGLMASVRFTGLIKEDPNESPHELNEVWHFCRDEQSYHWQVAGLQQH